MFGILKESKQKQMAAVLLVVVVYCVHFLLLCCTFQNKPSVVLVNQCSKRVEAAVAAVTLIWAGVGVAPASCKR